MKADSNFSKKSYELLDNLILKFNNQTFEEFVELLEVEYRIGNNDSSWIAAFDNLKEKINEIKKYHDPNHNARLHEELIAYIVTTRLKKNFLLGDVISKKDELILNYFFLNCDMKYLEKTLVDAMTRPTKNETIYLTILAAILALFKTDTDRTHFLKSLITDCLKKYNVMILQAIKNNYADSYNEILSTFNSNEIESINYLLSLDSDSKSFISEKMGEFSNDFGKITYEGGLLTCAQEASRKKHTYHPTVLRGEHEFLQFLEVLKTLKFPLSEQFIISGGHWISGQIDIDENGNAKIIIIDSNGDSMQYIPTQDVISHFADHFKNGLIYLSREKRQNAASGCSVFSLDDALHLATLTRMLPAEYEKSGIFGFLEGHPANRPIVALHNDTNANIDVISCQLPLSIIRTMQSDELLQTVIPARLKAEQDAFLKRKGITALDSAKNHHNVENPDFPHDKKRNLRLKYKLDNFAKKNAAYLLKTPLQQVRESMNSFTLNEFKKRALAASAKTGNIPKHE